MRRLHSLVQRLHAPRHKRRHRAAVEALLDELLRRAPDDLARNRLLRRALRDGLGTLWRSWRDTLLRCGRSTPTRRGGAWDSLRSDLSFALRFHGRRPMYALITVATLALAVGANTAIYAVAEAALFRSLPYRDADRVVEVTGSMQGLFSMTGSLEWTVSEEFARAPGIEAAGLYITGGGANLVAGTAGDRLTLTPVSDNFFDVMGVQPAMGGGFSALDDPRVAVIAHSVWTQAFGADPAVLGRTVHLSGLPYRIVGVVPAEVDFPEGTDVWVRQPVHWGFFSDAAGPTLIARLAPGVDRRQAQALLRSRTEDDRAEAGERARAMPPTFVPLRAKLTESVRAPLFVLLGAAAMVLLLGCLNLTGVAVSRFLRRRSELQLRRALGAGRARLFRQLVIEALLLGAVSGAFGLAIAAAGIRALLAWLPGDVPGLSSAAVGIDSTLMAAALATAAALTINVLAALPVLGNGRVDTSPRTATEGRKRTRLRSGLAVAQVTVALLLLIAAGLLGRTLYALTRTPLGIDVASVLTFEAHVTQPPRIEGEDDDQYVARIRARRDAYLEQVLDRLSGLSGVRSAGAVSQLPLAHDMGIGSRIRTDRIPEESAVPVRYFEATGGYFDAIGTRLIHGRSFSGAPATERREVILSRRAAESLFDTVDVAGREALFPFTGSEWRPVTIVGVVEDVRFRGPEAEMRPAVYARLRDSYDSRMGFAVRVAGDPRRMAERVTRAVAETDPAVPPFQVQTSRQALSRELSARQALATVSGLFAAIAVMLAAMGIYGLIAEGVARRRREIGIRVALGAPIGALVRAVAGRGFALAAAGIVIALPLALGGGRLLEDVLYGVSSTDPSVLIGAPLLLLVVAVLAAWLPARRAARVDPVEVLTAE